MTDVVKKMWAAYCKAAGGVTYDGKPLPTWEELGDNRQKCWIAAGKEAADEIERLREELNSAKLTINLLKAMLPEGYDYKVYPLSGGEND